MANAMQTCMTEEEKQVVFVCCCCLKNPAVPHYRKAPNTHCVHGCIQLSFFFRLFFPILSIIESLFSFFFFPRTSLGQSTAPSNLPFSYTTLGAAWFRCMLGCLQVSWHSSYKGLPPPLPQPIHDTPADQQTLLSRHSDKKFEENKKKERAIENKKGAHTKLKKKPKNEETSKVGKPVSTPSTFF